MAKREQMNRRHTLIAVVAAALVIAISTWISLMQIFPPSVSRFAFHTSSETRSSHTLPCGSSGVTCSNLKVDQLILRSANPPNASQLSVTLTNNGNSTINRISVLINNIVIATDQQSPDIGQTISLLLPVPEAITIQSGQYYNVTISSGQFGIQIKVKASWTFSRYYMPTVRRLSESSTPEA
jgi:archaellum component FlaF (FlaF/FlaG flagellin family)